jgi:gliding motility-associated-like protein
MTANAIVDDDFEIASSLYPILAPSDRAAIITFGRYTPWINDRYEIYRCTNTGANLELVGITDRETYRDERLTNGHEYCYRIRSEGYRNINSVEYRNENWSHIACVTPYDNVPPCAPELVAISVCDESLNLLTWSFRESLTYDNDNPSCWEDVEKYRIYFSPDSRKHPFTKVDSVMSRDILTYSHHGTLVGCYYVTAVDAAGNESQGSEIVCLDECGEYQLPNVFTPNGDNINDLFKSYNPGGVRRVDMKIYNRTGKLVFKTENPDINWDGRDIDSKRFVASGVYYYICEVYEERMTSSRMIPLSGIIHVYSGPDAQP